MQLLAIYNSSGASTATYWIANLMWCCTPLCHTSVYVLTVQTSVYRSGAFLIEGTPLLESYNELEKCKRCPLLSLLFMIYVCFICVLYTGFGTEEDSLLSCSSSLMPSPPRKRRGEELVLRFTAELQTPFTEDIGRQVLPPTLHTTACMHAHLYTHTYI
jgi:hypothetical protein